MELEQAELDQVDDDNLALEHVFERPIHLQTAFCAENNRALDLCFSSLKRRVKRLFTFAQYGFSVKISRQECAQFSVSTSESEILSWSGLDDYAPEHLIPGSPFVTHLSDFYLLDECAISWLRCLSLVLELIPSRPHEQLYEDLGMTTFDLDGFSDDKKLDEDNEVIWRLCKLLEDSIEVEPADMPPFLHDLHPMDFQSVRSRIRSVRCFWLPTLTSLKALKSDNPRPEALRRSLRCLLSLPTNLNVGRALECPHFNDRLPYDCCIHILLHLCHFGIVEQSQCSKIIRNLQVYDFYFTVGAFARGDQEGCSYEQKYIVLLDDRWPEYVSFIDNGVSDGKKYLPERMPISGEDKPIPGYAFRHQKTKGVTFNITYSKPAIYHVYFAFTPGPSNPRRSPPNGYLDTSRRN